MKKTNKIALTYLMGTSIFYGLLIVVQKMGLNSGLDPLTFSFLRSVVVILISIFFFSSQFKNLKFIKKLQLRNLIILGFVSALSILILFLGQKITSAINAGFLIRLIPLFVLPLTSLLLKEKISTNSIFFMFTMLIGVFLLITNGAIIIPNLGDLLIILVALIVAFQNVFAKKIMQNISTDIVILFRVFISALIITIFTPIFINNFNLNILSNSFYYVLFSAILYFLSVVCQYRAIKLIGPFITTTFFLSGSLFSALFAYILLGEILSFIQWIGVVGILLGGYLLLNGNKAKSNNS